MAVVVSGGAVSDGFGVAWCSALSELIVVVAG